MKVIDERKWQGRVIVCVLCTSVLEIDKTDLWTGWFNNRMYVRCPVCRKANIVEDLPNWVWHYVTT